MSENQIKEEIEKIGYKEFYRYYKEKDILLHQQQQELEKYKNNWEELKKLLEQELETIKNDEFFCNLSNEDYIGFILNKMKELEEDK